MTHTDLHMEARTRIVERSAESKCIIKRLSASSVDLRVVQLQCRCVLQHDAGGLVVDAHGVINGSALQVGGDAAVANPLGDRTALTAELPAGGPGVQGTAMGIGQHTAHLGVLLLQVLIRLAQEACRTNCRVANRFADLRVYNLDQRTNEWARRVVLATVAAGVAHPLDLLLIEHRELVLLGLGAELQAIDQIDDLAQVVAALDAVLDLAEDLADLVFDGVRAGGLGFETVQVGEELLVDEVAEIVEFLKDPKKFQTLGGRIPRGVLLMGPPGTGKTLLAKAIAGEAGVPFFSISGSEFVEMFVGVGASRVRDMFEQAKKNAPCIIFIDEIDAVGRHRGAGLGGGHDEREQTLNQLLVEMDGFEGNEGIIVIAATNRPDVLDPALLRPGRFDRQVVVPLPDVRGREQILKVHMRKVPLGDDVKPALIARGTPGFSGADLANLVNEAALFAARANKRIVGMEEFERAKDKIMMGAERRSMVMTEEEKRMTAYHEAGHAIVGVLVPEHDPVYKVTIIPRGRALGVTQFLPEQDRYSMSKRRIESAIATLFGGRIAEELIFGADSVTTGASNDIERATDLARNMVTKWGLSDKLGPLTYSEESGEVFLGRSVTQTKQVSDETAHAIDQEVRRVIESNYQRAKDILQTNLDKLHAMSDALMKFETIDDGQIKDIMEGREPRPPAEWDDSGPSNKEGGEVEPGSSEPTVGGPASQH